MKRVTKIICGRRVRLAVGLEYIACAPIESFSSRGRAPITVSIYLQTTYPHPNAVAVATVPNLNREGAWEFLRVFNNRKVSFMGRRWTNSTKPISPACKGCPIID